MWAPLKPDLQTCEPVFKSQHQLICTNNFPKLISTHAWFSDVAWWSGWRGFACVRCVECSWELGAPASAAQLGRRAGQLPRLQGRGITCYIMLLWAERGSWMTGLRFQTKTIQLEMPDDDNDNIFSYLGTERSWQWSVLQGWKCEPQDGKKKKKNYLWGFTGLSLHTRQANIRKTLQFPFALMFILYPIYFDNKTNFPHWWITFLGDYVNVFFFPPVIPAWL